VRKRELERFKQKLYQDRERIMSELEELSANLNDPRAESPNSSAYSNHMADLGTDAMEREKAFYYASQDRIHLGRIERALRRIEDANYGVCESCNKDIPIRRLEAVPDATLCIACQEEQEKKRS
jgi:DnaK suppressor protein